MRRIDAATGKPSAADPKLYSLASRAKPEEAEPAKPGLPPDWEAIEAPFVVRHGHFIICLSHGICAVAARRARTE